VVKNSIGLIELSSIAAGFQVTDAMLKAANVELVLARTICSGKYMVVVCGDVSAVQSSVAAGKEAGDFSVIDTFVIPNIHEAVFPALSGASRGQWLDALGIVESFSVASLIEGADAAAKASAVQLCEVRLAMAMGGKAFFTCTGSVSAVEAAVDAATVVIGAKGLLVNRVVIPNPRQELLSEMV
jgi:microcompartment protein CcmL/EutN